MVRFNKIGMTGIVLSIVTLLFASIADVGFDHHQLAGYLALPASLVLGTCIAAILIGEIRN